jgi:OOP family OmpA-OmpF porin
MKMKAWHIQILGILALALLFILALPIFNHIPATLQAHLTQQLAEKGHDWVSVTVKGRDVTLSGNAPTTETSFAALKVAKKYNPLLHINDQITPRIIQPYSMKMDWNGKSLLLDGYLPDKASYNRLLETAHQALGGEGKKDLQNNLVLGAGAPENWEQLLNNSLQALLTLQQGNVEIINHSFYFAGQTPYSAERDKIMQNFAQYKHYQQTLHIIATDEKDRVCQSKFEQLLENNTIKFTSGEVTIDPSSYSLLTKLANIAALCSLSKISIEGHTDNMGSVAANMKLSRQRAQSVVNWLFQQGIAEQQLSAIGYGAQKPIANNNTDEGRAANRRIEFIIKGKED